MDGEQVFEDETTKTRTEFPRFRIIRKEDSRFMKFLSFLLFFSPNFMTHFVTTIGYAVYVPNTWSIWSPLDRAAVLRHERVHMRQRARYGALLFSLIYLLFPLPVMFAYGRTKFEQEAYRESLIACYDYWGADELYDVKRRDFYIECFTGGAYGWMWCHRKSIERWYDRTVREIASERR